MVEQVGYLSLGVVGGLSIGQPLQVRALAAVRPRFVAFQPPIVAAFPRQPVPGGAHENLPEIVARCDLVATCRACFADGPGENLRSKILIIGDAAGTASQPAAEKPGQPAEVPPEQPGYCRLFSAQRLEQQLGGIGWSIALRGGGGDCSSWLFIEVHLSGRVAPATTMAIFGRSARKSRTIFEKMTEAGIFPGQPGLQMGALLYRGS